MCIHVTSGALPIRLNRLKARGPRRARGLARKKNRQIKIIFLVTIIGIAALKCFVIHKTLMYQFVFALCKTKSSSNSTDYS